MQTELCVQVGVQGKIVPYDEIMPKRKKKTDLKHMVMSEL
jgi:hypothetical protein